jgi:rod shape-determining protein MreC
MESFLNRYRNITVLLLVIFAQLVLLALQVKNDQDVSVIRVWAITMVTPVARVAEWFRGGSVGFLRSYVLLKDASTENSRLREEVGRLRIENNFLRNELNTADRAKALQLFKAHTPSKLLAANVISMGAGSNSKVVLVNRGTAEGVMRGMAVVTPDGIVGKVIGAYPTASEVMLITDPEFTAGVISQKSQARGIVKGQGNSPLCKVDYVPFEEKVEVGEWFYSSGDDRVFPRGFAVGMAKVVRPGTPFKEIEIEPSGLQHGLEDVLILLETVHQAIPDTPPTNQPVYIAPPPPGVETSNSAPGLAPATGTEADKVRDVYKSVGEAQNHTYGTGPPGSKPPDFRNLPGGPSASGATGSTGARSTTGASGATGPSGVRATSGASGATGLTGARSTTGASGATGPTGVRSTTGASGLTGPRSTTGGVTGSTGGRLIRQDGGVTGATGPRAVTGVSGAKGTTEGRPAPGTTGATGSTNPSGGGQGATAPPKGPGGLPRL